MNVDDFLDRMMKEDDDNRTFEEMMLVWDARVNRSVEKMRAELAEVCTQLRLCVRNLAERGLSPTEIADAVDDLLK